MIIDQSAAVSIGFVLDAIFGDPDFKLHPIRLIGYLISFLEKVMCINRSKTVTLTAHEKAFL